MGGGSGNATTTIIFSNILGATMAEYDDMASFAKMFSNSNAGGKMTKKKSAAARQKAKAKGMKGAAYIALGKPAGKKGKDSKGKNSGSKGSGSRTSSSSSSKSKPMVNTGSPYATAAAAKGKSISDQKNAELRGSAAIALGSPMRRQPTAKDYQRVYNQVAGMALGNPMTKQVRAKPASSKPASSKPASSKPASSKTTTTTTAPKKPTTSTTTPKFRPNVKPLKPVK